MSEIRCLVHEQLETMQHNTMRQMPFDKFSKSELILNGEGSCKDIFQKTSLRNCCLPEREMENAQEDEKNSNCEKFQMDFKYDEFKAIFGMSLFFPFFVFLSIFNVWSGNADFF